MIIMKKQILGIAILSLIVISLVYSISLSTNTENITESYVHSDDIIIDRGTSVSKDPTCNPNGIDLGEPPKRNPTDDDYP